MRYCNALMHSPCVVLSFAVPAFSLLGEFFVFLLIILANSIEWLLFEWFQIFGFFVNFVAGLYYYTRNYGG